MIILLLLDNYPKNIVLIFFIILNQKSQIAVLNCQMTFSTFVYLFIYFINISYFSAVLLSLFSQAEASKA